MNNNSSTKNMIQIHSSDESRASESVKFQLKAIGEDAKNYDFVRSRPPARTFNVLESIGHLLKGCLGGGVVAIHESYKNCGIWTALTFNFVLGFIVSFSMYTVVRSGHKIYGRVQVPAMTYPELAEASLQIGPWTRLQKYSKCFRGTYSRIDYSNRSLRLLLRVSAHTLKQLFEGFTDEAVITTPSIRIYIISLILPFVVLSMTTTMKYFEPFSIVANVFVVTTVVATVYHGWNAATTNPINMPMFKSVPGLFELMGVCVFSVEGIGVTQAVENAMNNPKKFPIVLVASMSIVILMNMVVGFFGCWGFGDISQSPVTINFPWTPFAIILKVSMTLMIYITFVLNFWIPFNMVWSYLKKRHNPLKLWLWERIYRALHIATITLVACAFPNAPKFMAVIGSFCLSNIGLFYPSLIELSLDWNDPGLGFMMWRLWKCVAISILALTLCLAGTYINVEKLILDVYFT